VSSIGGDMERSTNFAVSHDGRFIVAQQRAGLVLHDVERGTTSPLPARGSDPNWSPDDREIAYTDTSVDGGIYALPAFGGQPRRLFKTSIPTYVEDWSGDGRWLVAVAQTQPVLIPLAGGDAIHLDLEGPSVNIDELQFSPDSKWLAYGAVQPSGNQVYLTSVPAKGQRWQVSVGGGSTPRWGPGGRSLYYLDPGGALMKVEIELHDGAPKISAPKRFVEGAVKRVQPLLDQFSVTRDGRFLARTDASDATTADTIQVVVNWPTLLKAGARPVR
jgi:Tol biopolymer transport system component